MHLPGVPMFLHRPVLTKPPTPGVPDGAARAGPETVHGDRAPRSRAAGGLLLAVGQRVGAALLVLWVAVTVTFFAVHATPGAALDIILGDLRSDPELRAATAAL